MKQTRPTFWTFQIKLLVLMILIMTAMSPVRPVSAQTGTTFSLSVKPPVAYLSMRPGETANPIITIANEGSSSVVLKPTLVDFEPDPQGSGIILSQNHTFPYLDATKPDPLSQSLTLQPGERKNIAIPIAIPTTAVTSEHHLTLLFPGDPLGKSDTEEIGANISGVIASNLIVMITPTEQDLSQLQIEKFQGPTYIDSFMPISFQLWAKNDGPLAGVASGSAEVVNQAGDQVATWKIFPDIVLANSHRLVRTTGDQIEEVTEGIQPSAVFTYRAPFLMGKYRINVTFGSHNQLEKNTTSYPVVALPFSIIGLMILALTIIIGYKLFIKNLPIARGLKTY
jgi:hypothetical protein